VERADEGKIIAVGRVLAEQPEYPPAHLGGGFVGEGDRQYIERPDVLLRYQVSNPVSQRLGLTRTCAGQDENGSLSGFGG
jgi:hypothetical protein